jgi:HEAT repeat protein
VIAALGSAAGASYEKDIQKLSRDLLARHLSRQKEPVLKDKLQDDRAEVRSAAARVVGEKKLRLGEELIGLLADDDSSVRDAAHQALVRLNQGTDLGPKAKADEKDRSEAVRKWREWWAARNGK